MGEKKPGRSADVKFELPSKILIFLKEVGAFDDDWINERAAPVEFSALGLAKIFNVTVSDIIDAIKPYLDEENIKKEKKLKKPRKELKNNRYIKRKKMKLIAKDMELHRSVQYIYLLTPLGQENAENKLKELKKIEIEYMDEENKLIEKSIEEIQTEIIQRYGAQNRFFCHACLADFADIKDDINWKDFLGALSFKLDVQFQVKDDNNITIKEFIKKNWPELNTLIELMSFEPLKKYDFDDLFYPLNLTEIKKPENGTDKKMRNEIEIDDNDKKEKTISYNKLFNKILNENINVLIEGNAGTGKTIITRKLARDILKDNIFGYIPVYFQASKYENEDIYDFFYEQIFTRNLEDLKEGYEEILKEGRFIFLIDGLDEIGENYNTFINNLKMFKDQYSTKRIRNKIVLTSRPINIRSLEGFFSLKLKKLDIDTRIDFIRKLFQNNRKKCEKLIDTIKNDKILKETTSNPLLFSIVCLIYEIGIEIPDSISDIYSGYIEELLKRSQERKRKKDNKKEIIYVDKKKEILRELALYLIEIKKISFSLQYIKSKFNTRLPKGYDIKKMINEFHLDDGILIKIGEEYQFIHKSFQEYLSAEGIIFKGNWEDYFCNESAYIDINWWEPIFKFYAGKMDTNELILRINRTIPEDLYFTKLRVLIFIAVNSKNVEKKILDNISVEFAKHFYDILLAVGARGYDGIESEIDNIKETFDAFRNKISQKEVFIHKILKSLPSEFWISKSRIIASARHIIPPEIIIFAAENKIKETYHNFLNLIVHDYNDYIKNFDIKEIGKIKKILIKILKEISIAPENEKDIISELHYIDYKLKFDNKFMKEALAFIEEIFYKIALSNPNEDQKLIKNLYDLIIRISHKPYQYKKSTQEVISSKLWNFLLERCRDEKYPEELRNTFFYILRVDEKIAKEFISEKFEPPKKTDTDLSLDVSILIWNIENTKNLVERFKAVCDLVNYLQYSHFFVYGGRREQKKIEKDIDNNFNKIFKVISSYIEKESDWLMRNAFLLSFIELRRFDSKNEIFKRIKKIVEKHNNDPEWNLLKHSPLLQELLNQYLFKANNNFKDGLNMNKVSNELIDIFNKNGIELSDNLSVSPISTGEWQIYNKNNKFLIIESNDELRVFDEKKLYPIQDPFTQFWNKLPSRSLLFMWLFPWGHHPKLDNNKNELIELAVRMISDNDFNIRISAFRYLIKNSTNDIRKKYFHKYIESDLPLQIINYESINQLRLRLNEMPGLYKSLIEKYFTYKDKRIKDRFFFIITCFPQKETIPIVIEQIYGDADFENLNFIIDFLAKLKIKKELKLSKENKKIIKHYITKGFEKLSKNDYDRSYRDYLEIFNYFDVNLPLNLLVHLNSRKLKNILRKYRSKDLDNLISDIIINLNTNTYDENIFINSIRIISTIRDINNQWFISKWRHQIRESFLNYLIKYENDTEHGLFSLDELLQKNDMKYLFDKFKTLQFSKLKKDMLAMIWELDSKEHIKSSVIPYLVDNWQNDYLYCIGGYDWTKFYFDKPTNNSIYNQLYDKIWDKHRSARTELLKMRFSGKQYLEVLNDYKKARGQTKRKLKKILHASLQSLSNYVENYIRWKKSTKPNVKFPPFFFKFNEVLPTHKKGNVHNKDLILRSFYEIATEWNDVQIASNALVGLLLGGQQDFLKALDKYPINLTAIKKKNGYNFKEDPFFDLQSKSGPNLPTFLLYYIESGNLDVVDVLITLCENNILQGLDGFYPDIDHDKTNIIDEIIKGCGYWDIENITSEQILNICNKIKKYPIIFRHFYKMLKEGQYGVPHVKNTRLLLEDFNLPPVKYIFRV